MTKRLLLAFTILLLTTAMTTPIYANWKSDSTGWWFQENNGSYPTNRWKQIDDKWYYFNQDGYRVTNMWVENYYLGQHGAMLTNTVTPDGYYVGTDGAWVPQSKIVSRETAEAAVLRYYNNLSANDGAYVIFDNESYEDSDNYYFIVRYQMTDAEAEAIIKRGGWLSANTYVDEIKAGKWSGLITGEFGLQLQL